MRSVRESNASSLTKGGRDIVKAVADGEALVRIWPGVLTSTGSRRCENKRMAVRDSFIADRVLAIVRPRTQSSHQAVTRAMSRRAACPS